MKEATGELNMTVVTIIAIGAIIAFSGLCGQIFKIQSMTNGAQLVTMMITTS